MLFKLGQKKFFLILPDSLLSRKIITYMPTNREYFLADMVIAGCNARGTFSNTEIFS